MFQVVIVLPIDTHEQIQNIVYNFSEYGLRDIPRFKPCYYLVI